MLLAFRRFRALIAMAVYWCMRWFIDHCVLKVFFRRIDLVGVFRVPSEGPVIFVANHNNQFVDPLMLIANVNRVVRFLIAAKSLKRAVVGRFARSFQAIGVDRPQDLAKKGSGTITCQAESSTVTGEGTSFTTELGAGSKLKVGDAEMAVKSIGSDTACIVDRCPVALAKSAYKVLPRVDQSAVYGAVHDALKAGDCIGIFPEGGSTDRTSLLDLKPGVAVMALGAMQAGAGAVKIVPCGLNYFDPHKFRSRVIVEFGDPFDVPASLAEKYATDKRGAVADLMKMVDDAMKGVMPGAQDYAELQALLTMRALYKPRGKTSSPEETLKLNKMFAMARQHMANDKDFDALIKEVMEYVDLLRAGGLRDRDVRLGLAKDRNMAIRTCSASAQLICLAPITIPTVLLFWPLNRVTTWLARREKANALAGSTVKIRGLDVVASYKIISSLVLIPVYSIFLSGVAAYTWSLGMTGFFAILFVGMPVASGIGIRACDHSVRCYLRCRATFLFCGWFTAAIFQKVLIDRRNALQERVQKFVENAKLAISTEALQEEDEKQMMEITRTVRKSMVFLKESSASKLAIPLEEVALHNAKDDAWVVIDGQIVDVTKWLPLHPGGEQVLLSSLGRDVTQEWSAIHKPGTLERSLVPEGGSGPVLKGVVAGG